MALTIAVCLVESNRTILPATGSKISTNVCAGWLFIAGIVAGMYNGKEL
jgi:hypothetical protein